MKASIAGATVTVAAISYLVPVPASAQQAITCWYNESGRYTGSDSGTGMPIGKLVKQSSSGDYAWSYTINAPDGTKCPRQRPAG